jgi:hypothetical protein
VPAPPDRAAHQTVLPTRPCCPPDRAAHLTVLHDLSAGRVVCHPNPGATWLILTRDLLEALGKRRDALPQARRVGDGAALVRTWMRAERVRHLIVLRVHRLRPLLAALAVLAGAAAVTVWLVWHDTDPPAPAERSTGTGGRAVIALREPSWAGRSRRSGPARRWRSGRRSAV